MDELADWLDSEEYQAWAHSNFRLLMGSNAFYTVKADDAPGHSQCFICHPGDDDLLERSRAQNLAYYGAEWTPDRPPEAA